ncbi:MAG: DUF11 domain-containing protein [Sphingomonas sp.]|uniref:hypothetical protein n=1 Tax=Sphingomonas sp. TaxID=28214 RepID=UPI001B099933|nr:hypothetical protein [Sphingomonas sp.]MBO9623858.1 DUF11 domain-containing protein [Sphingomonas sp.]
MIRGKSGRVARRATVALISFAATGFVSAAHAEGIQAGTVIVNKATASYNTGTSTSTVESNEVQVRVDELIDVAVASSDSSAQSASSTSAVLTYSVTNTGNGEEAFKLTANPSVAGNGFDGTVQTVAIDSNGNGIYDAGVDTVVTNGGASPLIAPDASITVFVVVALPAGATDAQTSQVRLTAEAVTGTGAPGTVFAGQGQGGGDAVDGASGGDDDALGSIVASLATVSLVKSQTVADPFGGTQPVPGAVITYTIVASVAGSGQAENLHVADVIPTGTTYQAGTLKLEGNALTDGADGDAGTASAAGVDVALGTVTGGGTRSVSFQVKIN